MGTPRTPPAVLKALGREPFPTSLHARGQSYKLETIYKHDFFAATGLFLGPDGHRVVLKIGRTASIYGLPAAWIGGWLARREARIYRALHDLDGVPRFVGRWERTGIVHDYVSGAPLQRSDRVSDTFFEELGTLLDRIHERGLAVVDLEKCENIILGSDGRPHLIDFQISWHIPQSWGTLAPLAWCRDRLQNMDRYHLLKHRRRSRPDLLTAAELTAADRRPWTIRVHRRIVAPLQRIRRGVLRRVDPGHATAPR